FFFSSRRRHTRCLSDWSSDVCSSDLLALAILERLAQTPVSLGRQENCPDTGCNHLLCESNKAHEAAVHCDRRPRRANEVCLPGCQSHVSRHKFRVFAATEKQRCRRAESFGSVKT